MFSIEQELHLKTKTVLIKHLLCKGNGKRNILVVHNEVYINYKDIKGGFSQGHTAKRERMISLYDFGDPGTLLSLAHEYASLCSMSPGSALFAFSADKFNDLLFRAKMSIWKDVEIVVLTNSITGTTTRNAWSLKQFNKKHTKKVHYCETLEKCGIENDIVVTTHFEKLFPPYFGFDPESRLTPEYQKTFDKVFPKKFRYGFFLDGGN